MSSVNVSKRTLRLAARRQKSTAIHGVLTVLTLGLWSPVWIAACMQNASIRRAIAEVERARLASSGTL